jgi:hypothetical protein
MHLLKVLLQASKPALDPEDLVHGLLVGLSDDFIGAVHSSTTLDPEDLVHRLLVGLSDDLVGAVHILAVRLGDDLVSLPIVS